MKFLILVVLAAFSAGCCYAEILFTDDFSDGDDDGWTTSGAAEIEVISEEYFFYSQAERGFGMSTNGDQSGSMSTADYSLLCSVNIEAGIYAGLVCRYTDAESWYYRLLVKPNSDQLQLERRKDTGLTFGLASYSTGIEINTDYYVRFQVQGDSIQGRIWSGSIEDEPSIWHVTAQDAAQSAPGSFGLIAAGYGKVSWSVAFDDVVVSTPYQESLQNVTWGTLKSLEY